MYPTASYVIEWNDLRKLAKEINDFFKEEFDVLPITLKDATRQDIIWSIKDIFDTLADHCPKETWTETFPSLPKQAIDIYESISITNDLFVMVPHSFIEKELRNLTGNQAKVLLAYSRFASFSKENEGETFVGNLKIAKIAGVSPSNIDKIIRPLKEKGFVKTFKETSSNGQTKTKRKISFKLQKTDMSATIKK